MKENDKVSLEEGNIATEGQANDSRDQTLSIDSPEFYDIKRSLCIAINEAVAEAGNGNVVTITLKMEISSPDKAKTEHKEINEIKGTTTIRLTKTIDKYDDSTPPITLRYDGYGYKPNRRQVSLFEMEPVGEEHANG